MNRPVISLNLTIGQRAGVAVGMIPLLAAEAKKRQLAGLKKGDVPVEPNPVQRGDTTSRANEIAAEAVGVGKTTVTQMKKVTEERPDLAEEVKQGSHKKPLISACHVSHVKL